MRLEIVYGCVHEKYIIPPSSNDGIPLQGSVVAFNEKIYEKFPHTFYIHLAIKDRFFNDFQRGAGIFPAVLPVFNAPENRTALRTFHPFKSHFSQNFQVKLVPHPLGKVVLVNKMCDGVVSFDAFDAKSLYTKKKHYFYNHGSKKWNKTLAE